MKPKHSIHHMQLAVLGILILLLNPAALAQNQDRSENAADRAKEAAELPKEAAKIQENEEEKAIARRTKEANERAREAAEHAKEAAERTKEETERTKRAAERVKEDAKRAKQTSEKNESADEPAPEDEKSSAPENAPEPAAEPPTEKAEDPAESEAEEVKPQDNGEVPAKDETREVAPDAPAERESAEIPTSEPERQAENEVAEVTREVIRELEQRKARIEDREQAQSLIDDILGAESRISRAEIAREERFRPRFERQRPGGERIIEVSPDQRRKATTYFQQRLRGHEIEGPPPEFFGRSQYRGDRRDRRVDERVVERVVERVDYVRPRYLNEGRRYVHYDSRAAIPAILMAAQAMNHVRFQPTREIAPIFHERQHVSAPHAMPLPPEHYRNEDSWVVSYPVDENSMISSEDILFLQGSTQFSDPYTYEVVRALADAMRDMPEEERFVIEGHASAEGSYDSNMILSQQRAETIVRRMVRLGVSPYRLLPVGYGESEARHPANAAEPLRSKDRRVVVFRMKPEPATGR